MQNYTVIKNFMVDNNLKYLLVNSTNEFLVEYNSLDQNSRFKLTKFSGSTGEALVTPDTIYLFVDGRYHIQADQEVNHELVTVVKLQKGQIYLEELLKRIPKHETLGIFAKKNSQQKYEALSKQRDIKLLEIDPLDTEVSAISNDNISLDVKYTGLTQDEKISKISTKLADHEALFVTDLDEVSYIFNMRNFKLQPFSAKVKAKALIFKDNAILFTEDKLQNVPTLLKSLDKEVFVDKASINAYDYSLLKDPAELKENPIKVMKAQKNDAELEHLKEAFRKTDNAISAIRDYIENNDNISEYDIATQLEKEYRLQGALGLSFNSIVAKDKNSALAHYSKSSKDEIIENGSTILIDSGAYFEGGLATDTTRVFIKGEPNELQKKIYTTVLKAFLRAFNYANPTNGFEIDKATHEFFDSQDLDGFVFNHGLGHGIGINVHEYPPNLSSGEIAKTPIKEGMCFSIEPGLYKEGFFGVRLENSCYFKDNKIHSFNDMNYEKKLINFDMLTEQEKEWLKEFKVK